MKEKIKHAKMNKKDKEYYQIMGQIFIKGQEGLSPIVGFMPTMGCSDPRYVINFSNITENSLVLHFDKFEQNEQGG